MILLYDNNHTSRNAVSTLELKSLIDKEVRLILSFFFFIDLIYRHEVNYMLKISSLEFASVFSVDS